MVFPTRNEVPVLTIGIDINNVGSISQALYAKGDPDFDDLEAAKIQAAQVSTVSIMNFLGRIMIGELARRYKTHYLKMLIMYRYGGRRDEEKTPLAQIVLHTPCRPLVHHLASHRLLRR